MYRFKAYFLTLGICIAVLFGSNQPAKADDVASFYKGKTVSILIGFSAGGGYDIYARVLAKYLGKYIPGNPTVVPQNMTGAGSLRAAMYIYDVAPKDGTVIGTFSRSMPLAPLMDLPGAKFDATKFTWLGSVTTDTWTCISWKDAPVKTWNDMFTTNFTVGGDGKGGDPDVYATLIKNAFNAKIKLVDGYPGTGDIILAMQRHEVDGVCGYSYTTLSSTNGDWIKNKQINLIVQGGLHPDPDMPGVPFILDEATSESQKAMLRLALAPQAMARPFVAPPGIPADRAKALQQAFDDTMKDPGFLADAKKLDLPVDPLTGNQVEAMLTQIYKTSPTVVKQTRSIMGY
jgi:tripartite-type tricarboxylate transporter receptor subunit TctC